MTDDSGAVAQSPATPAWSSPRLLGGLTAAGLLLAGGGFWLMDPDARQGMPALLGLGAAAGVGAALLPLQLRSAWVRVLRIALLVPAVSVLPLAIVRCVSQPPIGSTLLGAAIAGAGVTLWCHRMASEDPAPQPPY